jgi:hypothetical protein
MQGSISLNNGVQFADLLQMLSGGHLSGRLEVQAETLQTGWLELNKGLVTAIDYAGLQAVPALAKLLKEPSLRFQFHVGEVTENPGLYHNTTELLMEAALWADTRIATPESQEPSYFTIKNRIVLNSNSQEEATEILAEFDFLYLHLQSIGNTLGFGSVSKFILKEDQALLAFHVSGEEDVMGYQSLKPCPLVEAFNLF